MAQVTIYIPDDLERELRQRARRSGRSLSSVVADLARKQLHPAGWSEDFKALAGSWEGELEVPDDPPPDDVAFMVREPTRPRRRSRK